MKYYRITAYTPYVGEEMVDYLATDSEDKLHEFADELAQDYALEWEPCWDEYTDHGYNFVEDYQEDYYAGCGARIEEITETEYLEETKPVGSV